MMKRKWMIVTATLATLTLSAGVLAACSGGGDDPEDYTFTNPPTEGLAQPDEGFKIDGVFDEAAYQNQRWFRGVKVEKDNDNLDYDRAADDLDGAATFSMTTAFGEKGVYIAVEYTAAEGERLFVNPDRASYLNSITELYFAPPGVASINDIGACEIDMQPTGALSVKRKSADGGWSSFPATNDIMAQLGVTCNGAVGETIPDGEERATAYTCELFMPWAYIDKIGGAGTADIIKNGGEIYLNAAPITSYNYLGTNNNVDRWWWMIGSQLDDGAWGNVNGWYHFNKDGLVAHDLEITATGSGSVTERMGYDFAVANNSVVILTKADEGNALTDIKVNGTSYMDSLVYTDDDLLKGYITIPASAVKQDLKVEATFEPFTADPKPFTAKVVGMRFGEEFSLAGATLTLTGPQTYTFTVGTDGTVSGNIVPGQYDASLAGEDYKDFSTYTNILFRGITPDLGTLTFGEDVFTQSLYGNANNTTIDDAHANEADAYVSLVSGNSFLPITNETFGDSVFSVTFNKNHGTGFKLFGLIFDDSHAARVAVGMHNDKISYQNSAHTDWGITPAISGWTWYDFDADGTYTEAWNAGKGIVFTAVREGANVYYFVAIDGQEDTTTKYTGVIELPEAYAEQDGHWMIMVGNPDQGSDKDYHFSLDDRQDAIDHWLNFSVNLPEETTGGKVTADKTTAKIGETITLTVTPDAGMAVSSFTVNGVARQLTDGKITLTIADGLEIDVAVTFVQAEPVSFELSVPDMTRLGSTVALNGKKVRFSGTNPYEFTVAENKIAGEVLAGTYTVSLEGYGSEVPSIEVTIEEDGTASIASLAFVYDIFTQGQYGSANNTTIDDTHANDADGYVSLASGDSFLPITNEAFGDSVFSVTFNKNQGTGFKLFGLIFDDSHAARVAVGMHDNKISFQNSAHTDWGIAPVINNWQWYDFDTDGTYTAAWNEGKGIVFTAIREGANIYYFVAIEGQEATTTKYVSTATLPEAYAEQDGRWMIMVGNPQLGTDKNYHFSLDDRQDAVDDWLSFSVTLPQIDEAQGKVEADKTTAKFGETITITVTPATGMAVESVTVNGAPRQLTDGKLTLTYADGLEIVVNVTFMKDDSVDFELTVPALNRLGETVSLNGKNVVFRSSANQYTFEVTDGKISGELLLGEYTVTLEGYGDAVASIALTATAEGLGTDSLAFVYDVFTQSKYGDLTGSAIDDSHANEADGYISFVSGVAVNAITNETFGDSVFSVTFNKNNTGTNFQGPALVFENNGDPKAARFCMKPNNDKIDFQNEIRGDWGIDPTADNWDWYGFDTDGSYTTAWNEGKGIVWTLVRSGLNIYFFVAIEGAEETTTLYAGSYTLPSQWSGEGHWAIMVSNADTYSGHDYHFSLSDDAATVKEYVDSLNVTVTDETAADAHGSVSWTPENPILRNGITFTVQAEEGYILETLLVNGSDVASSVNDGKYTLSGNMSNTVTVKATFKAVTSADRTFTITQYGADGMTFTFTKNDVTLTGKVTEGELQIPAMEDGTWLVKTEAMGMEFDLGSLAVASDTVSLDGCIKELFPQLPADYAGAIDLANGSFEYLGKDKPNMMMNVSGIAQGDAYFATKIKMTQEDLDTVLGNGGEIQFSVAVRVGNTTHEVGFWLSGRESKAGLRTDFDWDEHNVIGTFADGKYTLNDYGNALIGDGLYFVTKYNASTGYLENWIGTSADNMKYVRDWGALPFDTNGTVTQVGIRTIQGKLASNPSSDVKVSFSEFKYAATLEGLGMTATGNWK